MATQAYTEQEVALQNGKDVVLRQLVIARLRRFMAAWQEFADVETDEDGFKVFINCCGIALEEHFEQDFKTRPTKAEEEEGAWLSKEYKEELERILDLPTIYLIMEVCGDIKLNDPKLLEAAAALAQSQTEETQ